MTIIVTQYKISFFIFFFFNGSLLNRALSKNDFTKKEESHATILVEKTFYKKSGNGRISMDIELDSNCVVWEAQLIGVEKYSQWMRFSSFLCYLFFFFIELPPPPFYIYVYFKCNSTIVETFFFLF